MKCVTALAHTKDVSQSIISDAQSILAWIAFPEEMRIINDARQRLNDEGDGIKRDLLQTGIMQKLSQYLKMITKKLESYSPNDQQLDDNEKKEQDKEDDKQIDDKDDKEEQNKQTPLNKRKKRRKNNKKRKNNLLERLCAGIDEVESDLRKQGAMTRGKKKINRVNMNMWNNGQMNKQGKGNKQRKEVVVDEENDAKRFANIIESQFDHISLILNDYGQVAIDALLQSELLAVLVDCIRGI
ncbi:MAG: hypothetical protein EZS28_046760, partial [Streblomastix strix]